MSMHTRCTGSPEVSHGFRHRLQTTWATLARWECGASLAEFAVLLPFLTLTLLGVIDMGRAYYLSIEVNNAAYTGAMYGSNNPTDTTGMQNAATGDAVDVSGMTATATYGCECSDGSSPASPCPSTPPTCTYNVVNYVKVTTSATYHPLLAWPGIPSTISLTGSAKVRAQ